MRSSNIASIGYNPSSYHLQVEFNSGGVFDYFGVPHEMNDQLMSATSKGRFLRANIIGRFRTTAQP